MNYYNDNDPRICAWLQQLVKAGHIPDGDVDCRSITEVQPDDLLGYAQCHFFCGIAGWPLALRNLGLGEVSGIWTGSCPCQPFSSSGRNMGVNDPRHLWPEFFRLIKECRPEHVFGEQVADAIAHGWSDLVQDDLEGEGYTFGQALLGACSIGADHERERIYWAANSTGFRQSQPWQHREDSIRGQENPFREADRFVLSVRRGSVPYLCGSHDGFPCGVDQIAAHGMGNAIVPQVAEAFITSYFEALNELS